jgi:ribose-phosphate pyrophosphokinase
MSEIKYTQPKDVLFLSGNSNPELFKEVSAYMGMLITPEAPGRFGDNEIQTLLGESASEMRVVTGQSHGGGYIDVDKAIAEQVFTSYNASTNGANRVIILAPYWGYSRQDKKGHLREPIACRAVVNSFEANGATSFMSMHLHAGQIQGFSSRQFDNIPAIASLKRAVLPMLQEGVVVVSPDAGGESNAKDFRRQINYTDSTLAATSAHMDKRRPEGTKDKVEILDVVGDVKGRQCLIVDDIGSTLNTQNRAAEALLEKGATEVMGVVTHLVGAEGFAENLSESLMTKLFYTNTRAVTTEQIPKHLETKTQQVPIGKILSAALLQRLNRGSVSGIIELDQLDRLDEFFEKYHTKNKINVKKLLAKMAIT